jgi:hypothetical protein
MVKHHPQQLPLAVSLTLCKTPQDTGLKIASVVSVITTMTYSPHVLANTEKTPKKKTLTEKLADPINKKIKERYHGIVEDDPQTDSETLSLPEVQRLLRSQDNLGTTIPLQPETPKFEFDLTALTFPTLALISTIGLFFLLKRPQLAPQESPESQEDKPWYNRSLLGKYGLVELAMSKLGLLKPEVSESTIFLHNRALEQLTSLGQQVRTIDNEKFSSQEFLYFAKLKYSVMKGIGAYEHISPYIPRFQSAIKAQKAYMTIHQIELSYRGTKQQEFYQFVDELITNYQGAEQFRAQMQHKMAEIMPQIKTEEGNAALQSYAMELERLAHDKFGLRLISLFKTAESNHYTNLKTVSDLMNGLREKQITELKSLISIVIVNYDAFENVGQLIGLPEKLSTPDTYSRMVQYLALDYRHQQSFSKFDDLINMIQKWYKPYHAVIGIREEYPPKEYRQPEEFNQPLVGEELYLKYKQSLTDQKTGYTFIDFEEDETLIQE